MQSWLLYYSLPGLVGYLPDKYLCHFIHLAEGVYILLGDGITPVQLARACDLLQTFNKDFQHLYSKKTQWKSQLYIQILISFCNHYTVGLIRILNPADTSFLFVSCCSCCCFKVTCPRLVSLCQTNILKPLSNILSDNNIYFSQRGEKAAGVLIIPLGLFLFIFGKRNNKKKIIFVALLLNKEKSVCGSEEFLRYVHPDGLTVLCLCPYVLIEKAKLLWSIFLG